MNRIQTNQGIKKFRQLLKHKRARSSAGESFRIALKWTRHWAGIKQGILQDTKTVIPATSARFLASIRQFLAGCNSVVILRQDTEEYRDGDSHLIEKAARLGIRNRELNIVNKVRLYMQVKTVSKIANTKGTHISKEWFSKGKKSSNSKKEWPEVGKPTEGMMKVWVKFLGRLCSEGNKLRKCLGK